MLTNVLFKFSFYRKCVLKYLKKEIGNFKEKFRYFSIVIGDLLRNHRQFIIF